jgi:hypothetical protein
VAWGHHRSRRHPGQEQKYDVPFSVRGLIKFKWQYRYLRDNINAGGLGFDPWVRFLGPQVDENGVAWNIILAGGTLYAVRVRGATDPKTHRHHTIPKEIQKKLPPHLRSDPDIIGRPGLPNRRPVEAGKHLGEVHDKSGISPKETGIYGGRYNLRFQEEIQKLGGYNAVTKQQVLEIRDRLGKEFGI